jgi:hypothetical protein
MNNNVGVVSVAPNRFWNETRYSADELSALMESFRTDKSDEMASIALKHAVRLDWYCQAAAQSENVHLLADLDKLEPGYEVHAAIKVIPGAVPFALSRARLRPMTDLSPREWIAYAQENEPRVSAEWEGWLGEVNAGGSGSYLEIACHRLSDGIVAHYG